MTGMLREAGLSSPVGSHVAAGSLDDKKGQGYGVVEPRFHLPRSANSSYPYVDEDPIAGLDIEVDDESIAAIGKKSLDHSVVDHMASKSVDPFYFASGNTKLSDCFWRTDDIIKEVFAFGDSMASVPQLSSKRGPSMSGYSAAFPYQGGGGTNYKRTGTLRGWSKSPPPSKISAEIEGEELDEEGDIYSLLDLAKKGYLE